MKVSPGVLNIQVGIELAHPGVSFFGDPPKWWHSFKSREKDAGAPTPPRLRAGTAPAGVAAGRSGCPTPVESTQTCMHLGFFLLVWFSIGGLALQGVVLIGSLALGGLALQEVVWIGLVVRV